MERIELSSDDLNFCADTKNLPELNRRWNEFMHGAKRDTKEGDRAYEMLSTALWYHKEKLISAFDRQAKLRVVK